MILAIESAVGGGSLCLGSETEQIGAWTGDGSVSRAEDLLSNIDLILKRSVVGKKEITRIAVSVGPGSFTGIRIGLATAMGLATALNVELARFSILHAMAIHAPDGESILAAVPVGRGVVCMQRFRKSFDEICPLNEPTAILSEVFDGNRLLEQSIFVTPEAIDGGLATCLSAAALDKRVPQTRGPLFIAKPANL